MRNINYLYRKGRIVTTNNGYICKVLARPGQTVYDNKTSFIHILRDYEYVLFTNELWIEYSDYKVAQYHTTPQPGFLTFEDSISISTDYEKTLRRNGINLSPLYNTELPEGQSNEIIAFKKLIYPYKRPRMVRIVKVISSPNAPLFVLSNGETIERGSLKLFYRKSTHYEETIFDKSQTKYQNRQRVLSLS